MDTGQEVMTTVEERNEMRIPGWLSAIGNFMRKHSDGLMGLLSVSLFLGVWEWAGTSGAVNPLFISSPSRIAAAYVELWSAGYLQADIAASARVFFSGLALSISIGIPLGILIGWYRPFEAFMDPFVNFFNATPRIALLPLFLIWFGIGNASKVAVVFMTSVFPILINTVGGVKTSDVDVVRAARSFGASDFQLFRTVILPSSVPSIITGLRLGLARALAGTVVAELLAATAGIGYLIAVSGNTFQTDHVFVGITLVAGIGVIGTNLMQRFERRFQSWKPQAR